MRAGMLRLLAKERRRLDGHLRIGDQRFGVLDGGHQKLLEADSDYRGRVHEERELRIVRVPLPGHVTGEIELRAADFKGSHRVSRYSLHTMPIHVSCVYSWLSRTEESRLMGRKGWAGSPPADDAEARKRIIDAALRLVDRRGAAQTTANLARASSVTGVNRLTRLPSGSRNSSARLPQGIVVGAVTISPTCPRSRSYSASTSSTRNSIIALRFAPGSADPAPNSGTVLSLPIAKAPTGVGISAKSSLPHTATAIGHLLVERDQPRDVGGDYPG